MQKIYKIASFGDLGLLDYKLPLLIDTETAKLGSQIRLIQLYQTHLKQVLIFDTKDISVEVLYSYINDFHLVYHNGLYDAGCFKTDMGSLYTPTLHWDDTFYLSRLAFPEWEKFSLDICFYKMLRYDPYEEAGLDKKILQKSFHDNRTGPLTDDQYLYSAIDVYYLGQLYDLVKHMEDDFNYLLDKSVAEKSVQMQDRGMPVDIPMVQKMKAEYEKEFKDLTYKLKGLNSNSWQQVRKALGTENSSDGPSLAIIASREGGFEGLKQLQKLDGEYDMVVTEPNYVHTPEKVEIAKNIIAMRHVRMRLSYCERTFDAVNENSRITAQFSPHAITGRVQPNNENLSQWPRDMKALWGFDETKDRVLVYSDYSQLELRSLCALIGEPTMYATYKSDLDIHTKTQTEAKIDELDVPSSTSPRMVAKMINFLSIYGGGVDSFQKQFVKMTNTWLEAELVRTAMTRFKDTFTTVKTWHHGNSKQLNEGNYIGMTVSGRRYSTSSYTEFNNIQNQGSGTEVAKLAWHYMVKYGFVNNVGLFDNKVENDGDVYMVNFTHDSYLLDCPNIPDVYKKAGRQLMACMQVAWFQIMKNSKYPDLNMPCDCAVDKHWDVIEYGDPMHKDSIDGMKYYGKDPDYLLEVE